MLQIILLSAVLLLGQTTLASDESAETRMQYPYNPYNQPMVGVNQCAFMRPVYNHN